MSTEPTPSSSKPTATPAASSSKPTPTPAPAQSQSEDVEMDAEEDTDAAAKKEADALKAQGTVAYKARKFEEAAELYQKAWDTYSKDVTYLTNLSGELSPPRSGLPNWPIAIRSMCRGLSANIVAVYFEQGEYAKCIETCEKAVEEGRELRVDYKTYAKYVAFTMRSSTQLTM